MLDPAIGSLIVVSLAALLGFAALHKLNSGQVFVDAVAAYRLLPDRAVRPLSRLVPWLELATSLGLVIPAGRRFSCAAAAALMVLYAGAIGINLIRGRRHLDCGCGIAQDRRPIAGWMLFRNGAVALFALAAGLPWTPRPLEYLDLLTVVAGTAAAALLYASIDVLLGRVAPRAAVRVR